MCSLGQSNCSSRSGINNHYLNFKLKFEMIFNKKIVIPLNLVILYYLYTNIYHQTNCLENQCNFAIWLLKYGAFYHSELHLKQNACSPTFQENKEWVMLLSFFCLFFDTVLLFKNTLSLIFCPCCKSPPFSVAKLQISQFSCQCPSSSELQFI